MAKLAAVLPALDELTAPVAAGCGGDLAGPWRGDVGRCRGWVGRVMVTRGVAGVRAGLAADGAGVAADWGRVRKPGGGRKLLTVTDPGLMGALEALVDPQTRRGADVAVAVDDEVDHRTWPRPSPAAGIRSVMSGSGNCCAPWATACRATPSRWRAGNTQTGTASSATSTPPPVAT